MSSRRHLLRRMERSRRQTFEQRDIRLILSRALNGLGP
jgi:hypothetical protein